MGIGPSFPLFVGTELRAIARKYKSGEYLTFAKVASDKCIEDAHTLYQFVLELEAFGKAKPKTTNGQAATRYAGILWELLYNGGSEIWRE